jgi:hypothetical protein
MLTRTELRWSTENGHRTAIRTPPVRRRYGTLAQESLVASGGGARRSCEWLRAFWASTPDADVGEAAGQEVGVGGALDKGGRLLDGQGTGFDRGRSNRGHAQAVELSERPSRFDDVEFGVCADFDESELVDLSSSVRPRERDRPWGVIPKHSPRPGDFCGPAR